MNSETLESSSGATQKASKKKGGTGNRPGDGEERNKTYQRRSLNAAALTKEPTRGKSAASLNSSAEQGSDRHLSVAGKKLHSKHRDEKGDGGGSGEGKTQPILAKRWCNSDRLVALVEADHDKVSGPAKRARITDNATSAAAQAKPALSVINSKLEAKGSSGVPKVAARLNPSLAVEAPGEEKKDAQRKGTAVHKKRQSTLGTGDEEGGRHRRESSLRPRESKVSGSESV